MFGKTKLKNKYSTSSSTKETQNSILKAKNKFKQTIVSYNNTYSTNLSASNKIPFEKMNKILKYFSNLKVVKINHKHFNSGKTNFQNNKEYLFIANK